MNEASVFVAFDAVAETGGELGVKEKGDGLRENGDDEGTAKVDACSLGG